jgi:hypothetical protein
MGLFSKIKDNATSTLVKAFANHFISDFGNLNDIIINSENKSIYLSVDLKGEKESINIEITGYEVVKSQNNNFIKLHNITASREWINIALGKYYLDRRLEIPSQFIGIVKFLI